MSGVLDRLTVVARWLDAPPLQFVLALWWVASLAVGIALTQRTPIEQANSVLFLGAGVLFTFAMFAPRSIGKMTLAFGGFGVVFFATFARTAFALPVATTPDGAAIITAAWVLLTFKAAQRTAATFLAITGYRR